MFKMHALDPFNHFLTLTFQHNMMLFVVVELLLQVRAGGVIAIDNVLWHGKVADPMVTHRLELLIFVDVQSGFFSNQTCRQVNDAKTVGIRKFNKKLMEDKRVSISMVGIHALWLLL